MVEALRGLIKNDQAYAHMVGRDYPYEDIKTLLNDSLGDMDRALGIHGDRGEPASLSSDGKASVLKQLVGSQRGSR